MSEHPNTQDYINRAERNRDYWLEECRKMIGEEGLHCLGAAAYWDEEADDLRQEAAGQND